MIYQFVHVPKVAGLSFLHIMDKHPGIFVYLGHTKASDVKKIAFVRNPYDRLTDAYFYLMSANRIVQVDIDSQEILKQYPDFKSCVLSIDKDDLMNRIEFHFRPMSYYLCNEDNKIIIDRIFKIEEIETIDAFLASMGLPEKLSEIYANMTEYGNFMDHLDAEAIAEINRLYALDFELFGYTKL